MTAPTDADHWRKRNDALRAELVSAMRRTEHLVAASDDLLAAHERFNEEFRSRSFTAEIAPGLGSVTVTGDGALTIDLDHVTAATSDVPRLGERILAALAAAEREMTEAAASERKRLNRG
ncbi:YbaB/EbfC family nucleoid-associated protein [Actinomadura rayongensis]|uniref:YbaB/EbfC family DNA-binding protein n=1 Tax=Actinomadura rayongensis TaxID=1429076 RepID=A0A6I4VXU5_9ACTN|nr:hypothetical protein [Actinomadura rayongensis]MXQ63209.1 hypothetical protein [Actinomadura rayongensis]